MLRFGTIGTGWIANSYVDGALDSGLWQLTAVYSRTKEKGLAFAAPYGVKTVFTDLEEMAATDKIDAVYIASPNKLHIEQARVFLEHGKHVICEKPLSAHAKDVAELQALAKERGFETLQNGHPERGQSETIRLGARALSDCDAICFMVADQPLLRRETLAREVNFFSSHRECIVALGHNGARGNPCLFPARFFPELLALEGDVGGSAVIKNHLDALLLFESPEAELRDVDTKAALAAIRER